MKADKKKIKKLIFINFRLNFFLYLQKFGKLLFWFLGNLLFEKMIKIKNNNVILGNLNRYWIFIYPYIFILIEIFNKIIII
jgi:hypothetical protein